MFQKYNDLPCQKKQIKSDHKFKIYFDLRKVIYLNKKRKNSGKSNSLWLKE